MTGVWAGLGIGDHTHQFTQTFASGTNPPTYGDYPWRIYETNLDERYDVLNALKTANYGEKYTTTRKIKWGGSDSNYAEAADLFNAATWEDYSGGWGGARAWSDNIGTGYKWDVIRIKDTFKVEYFMTTNISMKSVSLYALLTNWIHGMAEVNSFYDGDGIGDSNTFIVVVQKDEPVITDFPITSTFGSFENAIPDLGVEPLIFIKE